MGVRRILGSWYGYLVYTNFIPRLPVCMCYPRGLRVEPDILVSIYGLAPGSSPHFQNPENI